MFLGQAGVGKTTAAQYLVEKYSYTKISFADPLKEIGQILWPEMKRFKYRHRLQTLGEKIREIDADIWINLLINKVDNLTHKGFNVVVDDVRYPNEFYTLLGKGFIPIKITTVGHIRNRRLLRRDGYIDFSTANHISEQFVNQIQVYYEIYNSKDDLKLFYECLDELIQKGELIHDPAF